MTAADHANTVRYAQESKTWTHGQKSEDELLQRIWNLAADVTALEAQAEGLELAQAVNRKTVDDLVSAKKRAEAAEDERDLLADALREIEVLGTLTVGGFVHRDRTAKIAHDALARMENTP